MTSERSARPDPGSGVDGEARPAPAWVGDVHAGVQAWTRSAQPGHAQADPAAEPAPARPRRSRGGRSSSGRSDTSSTRAAIPRQLEDPESLARKILLDALTGQARSRKELADKLAKKEIPGDVAERLLDRFEEVGLIDDEAFATAWIESRQPGKGLARRALAMELRRKGIDDDVARAALAEIDPDDEHAAARALVRKKLRSVDGMEQQKATRRLVGMLARKGYGPGMAFAIVREELRAHTVTEQETRLDDGPVESP